MEVRVDMGNVRLHLRVLRPVEQQRPARLGLEEVDRVEATGLVGVLAEPDRPFPIAERLAERQQLDAPAAMVRNRPGSWKNSLSTSAMDVSCSLHYCDSRQVRAVLG
jgi:hypothetical protein